VGLICRVYECPSCSQRYELVQNRDEGSPDECPKCGVSYAAPVLHVPGGFHLRNSDKVRAIEDPVRAYMEHTVKLAEEHNNPSLKVTNMRDNVRQGETYAMSVPKPSQEYQQMMAGGMSPAFGAGAGSGGGDSISPQQLIAGVRADGGGVGATPVIQQMVGNPMMPHRHMTGRFVRPK
jgi:hypothetical protein